jgi:hypothetical protein
MLFLPATQEKMLIEEHGEINPEKAFPCHFRREEANWRVWRDQYRKSMLFLPATQEKMLIEEHGEINPEKACFPAIFAGKKLIEEYGEINPEKACFSAIFAGKKLIEEYSRYQLNNCGAPTQRLHGGPAFRTKPLRWQDAT